MQLDPKKKPVAFRGEERGGGNRVLGIEEGICGDEHWVLYITNESLNTASKINDVLYSG